jgi:release factor glutamine methyltransferase
MTLREAVARLAEAGVETPQLDAEVLLAHALGVARLDLFARDHDPPPGFDLLIERRARREPVAYIVGSKGFRNLDLVVDPRVLIPRPETEHLVEAALGLPEGARVVDVGTGSGAVALALKDERPDLVVTGTDVSEAALEVASLNARRSGLEVRFVQGDLLAGVTADAVVSNPPYVDPDYDAPPELAYEPELALFGNLAPRLAAAALASGASFIALEHGADQADAVAALFPGPVELIHDLAGHPRVTLWAS